MYECMDFVCAVPCVLQGVGVYSCGFVFEFFSKVFSRENSVMADCCTNIMDLGCVGFCDTISTGVTAPATDTYVISLIGAGGYASYDFTIGEEIAFENPFNEDSTAVFQILRNGVAITSGIYDCFQVKVTAGINLVTAESAGDENTFNIFLNGSLVETFTSTDNEVNINIYP